jgi:excisionase family DNA binding protein
MTDRLEAAIRELVAAIREELTPRVEPDGPTALLSVAEAARRLGISRTTLYGEIAAGRFRSVKLGRRRIIPADAIADYVERLALK